MQIYSGNGNKFVLFDLEKEEYPDRQKVITQCSEKEADGCLVLEKIRNGLVKIDYFDKDGTRNNCGNGMRVASIHSHNQGYFGDNGFLETLDGLKFIKIRNGVSEVEIGRVKKTGNILWVSGVPHVVFSHTDVTPNSVKRMRVLYNANINIFKKIWNNVYNQTFETGVEDFTLSCGTGSVAVAHLFNLDKIYTDGGLLKIRKDLFGKYYISGSVETVK